MMEITARCTICHTQNGYEALTVVRFDDGQWRIVLRTQLGMMQMHLSDAQALALAKAINVHTPVVSAGAGI